MFIYVSFLKSKVIKNPFRYRECPPRLLGGRSGDSKENILFQWTEGPEILHIASSLTSKNIQTTQESKMSSKTPQRILWRLIGEYPLLLYLKAFNFALRFLNAYIYISFLTSKVIENPFRYRECPPRLLGCCSGDSQENLIFQLTKGPEILHRPF